MPIFPNPRVIVLALLALCSPMMQAEAGEICYAATVGQDRVMVRFCVEPQQERITRYTASGARADRLEERRTADAIVGAIALTTGRIDPPMRITSRYLLRDMPNATTLNSRKGQAAYQVCTWAVADTSCSSQAPGRGPLSCWKSCSSWYGYLPGTESID